MSVHDRFDQFLTNISLTDAQKLDGATKRGSVCKVLNGKYYNSTSDTANSIYVGSWGKGTRTRPPRDVDVLFKLSNEVYQRFEQRTGNKQSQLLQEIKNALLGSFQKTDIRGDGPVVKVPFGTYAIELLPAFELQSGQYGVPYTSAGGFYKTVDPDAEAAAVSSSNTATNNNTRDLVRMLKAWQANCNVPLKSFYLELLAIDFLKQWSYAGKSKTYYDWMCRDFFAYLINCADGYLYAPGTYEIMALGSAWKSRAETAYSNAVEATNDEEKYPSLAGTEWQRIFGTDIPI
ncbi:hypothetical protein HAP47_0022420 [Bradyrhizobium sp. 41S5]|uniref:SMODS domain-containing nucleotidyltransferase n=1 Tax=Bradyrhizobium sp. 41S5 TaxID=1404443 RepID=UPI00156BD27E|nr:nucleotidyltransferase [Bradyrhizobium sp. 41S5]UFX42027.1 hypothetical protein HAP47_0022420 [Bradyrhizobium sp. 41S5]